MKIAICDDDILFCNTLEEHLRNYFKNRNIAYPDFVIFHSGEDLLSYKESLDIIFLDIQMNGISGIEAGAQISARNPLTLIIIITFHNDYLDDALRFRVFRYLSKPLDIPRLYRNLQDAIHIYTTRNHKVLLATKTDTYVIYSADIIMIEAKNHKVYVECIDQTYVSNQTMDYWETQLKLPCFYRTHRSFIVNFKFVCHYDNHLVFLHDERFRAYLTSRKYNDFNRAFSQYIIDEE